MFAYNEGMKISTRFYAIAPLLLILASLGWAGNPIAGLKLSGNTSPMIITLLRWGVVAILLWLSVHVSIRKAWGEVRQRRAWVMGMGASIAFFNALFYLATNFTTAVNIGIIQAVIPVFILLLSFVLFAKKVSVQQMGGVLLTVLGVLCVVAQGNLALLLTIQVNKGDWIMLSACIFYAIYTVGLGSRPNVNGFVMMWFIAVGAFIATVPLVLIEYAMGYTQLPSGAGWWLMLYIILIPSYLSQVFFMRGVDLIGPSRAGLYANAVPIFTPLLGIVILKESFYWYHIVAVALVFFGICIFEYFKNTAKQ